MYKDRVTVFNCKRGAVKDTWYPTTLTGNLNMDKGAMVKAYGADTQDRCVLNVRLESDMIGGKKFLPPKEWQALEDPSDYITFNTGTTPDFFMAGEWPEGVVTEDGFYERMLKEKDYVFAVTSVGYFSVIPHLEVTGK